MDGVIYHGDRLLPDVKEFVEWLYKENKSFLFLTNSSERSPRELQQKLERMGLYVDESHFYTSALATAKFISSQKPGCSAYVIGAPGLVNALYDQGITMNSIDPDYVIVGETSSYNYETVVHASNLVRNGAKLIGTNTDLTGPVEDGIVPACRALISPIEMATTEWTRMSLRASKPVLTQSSSSPESQASRMSISIPTDPHIYSMASATSFQKYNKTES